MRIGGDHRSVVNFVDLFESPSHYYLVMEMASGGELFDRLVARGPYTEAKAAEVVGEVAEALGYLHGQGVVHFDVKPENILLHSESEEEAFGGEHHGGPGLDDGGESTMLTDFGSAFFMSAPAAERTPKPGSGTSAYLPPEALEPDPAKRGPCDTKADMWSLGVVMYILLSGAHPFDLENKASDREIERRIREDRVVLEGKAWRQVSKEGKALLRQLLDKVPPPPPLVFKPLLPQPRREGAL